MVFTSSSSCRENLPAFRSSGGKNFSAAGSGHSLTEAVYSFMYKLLRLICHFHVYHLNFYNIILRNHSGIPPLRASVKNRPEQLQFYRFATPLYEEETNTVKVIFSLTVLQISAVKCRVYVILSTFCGQVVEKCG